MTEAALDPRVMMAVWLINAGYLAVEHIREYVKQNGDDDALLAAILAEANVRIARREAEENAPPE